MKKLFFIAMVAFGLAANAQGQFNAGINFGLPLGDAGDASTFTLMPEVSYLFEVSDEFKVGPSVSYSHFFSKSLKDILIDNAKKNNLPTEEIEKLDEDQLEEFAKNAGIAVDDASFLPVAVAGRFNPSEDLIIGADLGYAVGLNEGNDGGFYYRPVVAYNVADNIALQLSYSGIMIADKDIEVAGKKVGEVEGSTASGLSLGAVFSF